MIDLTPILERGVSYLAEELFKAAIASASSAFRELRPYHKLNFSDHFNFSYQRCTKIKTIINGDTPTELLKSYVNLNFSKKKQICDDIDLIERMWAEKHVVVSGPAGSGKSMFMKYLWLSVFAQPKGKIPIFIELRKFGSIGAEDFITFIF